MKIDEILNRVSYEKLIKVASSLNLVDEKMDKNIFTKYYIQSKLKKEWLLNEKKLEGFCNLYYTQKYAGTMDYDESTVIDLQKIVFGFDLNKISIKNKQILESIFLLYEEECPDEIREIFKKIFAKLGKLC